MFFIGHLDQPLDVEKNDFRQALRACVDPTRR